jgi:hypothetical protein
VKRLLAEPGNDEDFAALEHGRTRPSQVLGHSGRVASCAQDGLSEGPESATIASRSTTWDRGCHGAGAAHVAGAFSSAEVGPQGTVSRSTS